MIWLAIALGGALGALARHATDTWAARRWGTRFPAGTLIVNLTGSAILGLVAGFALADPARSLIGTGFCGALTTFSGFAAQILDLKPRTLGLAYGLLSTLVGVGLAAAGFALGQLAA